MSRGPPTWIRGIGSTRSTDRCSRGNWNRCRRIHRGRDIGGYGNEGRSTQPIRGAANRPMGTPSGWLRSEPTRGAGALGSEAGAGWVQALGAEQWYSIPTRAAPSRRTTLSKSAWRPPGGGIPVLSIIRNGVLHNGEILRKTLWISTGVGSLRYGVRISRSSNSRAASTSRPVRRHRLKSAHWGSPGRSSINQQKACTWGSAVTTDQAAVSHPRG